MEEKFIIELDWVLKTRQRRRQDIPSKVHSLKKGAGINRTLCE